jgi:hypothetical protein|tara:strand:+ start:317 stop:448 length:132 start_codon:yes stop_codon:yes gene_type:complete
MLVVLVLQDRLVLWEQVAQTQVVEAVVAHLVTPALLMLVVLES